VHSPFCYKIYLSCLFLQKNDKKWLMIFFVYSNLEGYEHDLLDRVIGVGVWLYFNIKLMDHRRTNSTDTGSALDVTPSTEERNMLSAAGLETPDSFQTSHLTRYCAN
jgi:hypothetical protein